jgi:exodeoxyribonuclease-1
VTTPTFLWYDLETFGRDARRSRIAQFGAIRTDAQLQPVAEPVSLYCRPAEDLLPSPTACLLTGITPQKAEHEGVIEAEFMRRLHEEFIQAGTCAAGYNSLRFDDEFVRHSLYRNFFDPYEREWRNGNSRWDLLDLMRLSYALRPEGLAWPRHPDGAVSFKLEELAAANGVTHAHAHDALSDVEATLALARIVRNAQPKLFDYYLGFRNKQRAAALLDYANMTPVLHVSGRFSAARRCAALVLPIAPHPSIPNRVIVCDLDPDPQPWLALDAAEIADRLFTPQRDLPEGIERAALKEVHLNRCPALIELRHLSESDIERLQLDLARCEQHAQRLREQPDLADKVRRIYASRAAREPSDPDLALYDGFPDKADHARCLDVRRASPEQLARNRIEFRDPRYDELLFRYRARNWPESLSAEEAERWQAFRRHRLRAESGLSEYSVESYFAEIDELRRQRGEEPGIPALLDALQAWGLRVDPIG